MRPNLPATLACVLLLALPAQAVRSDDALYRCQAADGGVSIQSAPCPKGVSQRKIPFDRPAAPVAPPPAAAPAAVALEAGHPVAPSAALQGPNDPYPLWECMRPDGSTYESRTGLPHKQWVPKAGASDAADAGSPADPNAITVAQLRERMKKHEPIIKPYEDTPAPADAGSGDAAPPPPGVSPDGQWVADECTQVDGQTACERYAVRRDALRKQIYASKPSERALYAPEEQDLTTMLYAACGR